MCQINPAITKLLTSECERVLFRSMPTKTADKFEATRIVVDTVTGFDAAEQQMIFRWAAETLGLPSPFTPAVLGRSTTQMVPGVPSPEVRSPLASPSAQDIQSFVREKKPRSD